MTNPNYDPISGDLEAARLRDKLQDMKRILTPDRARAIAEQLENDGSDEMAEDMEAYALMLEEA